MKRISALLFLAGILIGSCAPVTTIPRPLPTNMIAPTSSQSPPTNTATETQASLRMTEMPSQAIHLSETHMMDETSGWAWALNQTYEKFLFHTSDGGQTWLDITPDKDLLLGSSPYSSFMLDAQTAWVILTDERLVRTSNGGQTWKVINQNLKDELIWPHRDWYGLRFADANHGWLNAGYSAAGAHEFYYMTQDGGLTWNPLNFETWPDDLYNNRNYKNELAFWNVIDAIYYDSTRFIIAPGEQEGTLKLFLSDDWGNSWKTVQLLPSAFPDQSFETYDRKISSPIFFDPQNGILTVTIWDRNANTIQLFVYGTSDGGLTWTLDGGPSIIKDARSGISFLSARDAVFVCGVNFCVTKDGGSTWLALDFGTFIPTDTEHTHFQLDFINPATGWLLLTKNDNQGVWLNSRLLRTTDGGHIWTEIVPMLKP